MGSKHYYPLVKTTVSELRAIKSLSPDDFKHVIPIFELTKSRKSKNNQGCDVYKKVDELLDIMKENEFILDLTNEESLTNEQIESFFDDDNAFFNWTEFIRRIVEEKGANVTPMILAYEDSDKSTLMAQAARLLKQCNRVCIRLGVELVTEPIVDELLAVALELEGVVVVIDLGYTREEELNTKINDANDLIQDVIAIDGDFEIVAISSSFPSSVVQVVPRQEKMSSKFQMYSKQIFSSLQKYDPELQYGDYACIHPFRGESRPMIWVPRVDYPYLNHVRFERCSRDDGGYATCAERIVEDSVFHEHRIDCWGCDEIQSAANGDVNGKSPSYWISVRSNIHMTRVIRDILDV
ncbi:beta family protein [Vibrio splendidus]|uniref:beta family protein n=1 Tax=Vibrio splendidus TaxID=29497 RepID=UPI000C8605F2|nr:beta family protein [Vibrio splendidus]PMJ97878.1 hypothetical protein BCU10_05400 [Vibrio splendidus]